MTYTPTVWVDEVPGSSPIKYSITGDIEGVISASAQIAIVTGVTPGTPLTATNLNKIENAIDGIADTVDAHIVKLAASPPDKFTTKGDLFAASAVDVGDRLAAGSLNKVLMADSSQTLGLKYEHSPVLDVKTNTSWDGDAPAAGTYAQTLSGWSLPANIRFLIVNLEATWSTAADNGKYILIRDPDELATPSLTVRNLAANIAINACGIVHVKSTGAWEIVVGGTGLSSAYVKVVGYFL
jgi:hypothetical protein